MPSFATPGALIDHHIRGESGPAVVQLHGLTSSRQREQALGLDIAGQIDDDLRLLAYDARGHGRSTGHDRHEDYRWPRLAADLHALLDDVFPEERIHGVGPSMGTGTLLHAAVADPDRFASLTLVIPPTAWRTRAAKATEYEWSARLVQSSGVRAFIEAGDSAPRPPATRGRPDTVPDVDEALLPAILRGAAGSDLPSPSTVAGLDVPTLILAWVDDPAHPLETAEKLHEFMPRSRLVTVDEPHDVEHLWPKELAEHIAAHS